MAINPNRREGQVLMENWTPICYKGFYDVPLVFLVPYRHEWFLFDCEFDEACEDYRDHYKVYLFPEVTLEDLPVDWTTLHHRAIRFLGQIPINRVRFDKSRRREMETSVLEQLATPVGGS
jgi:hypothetical protein